MAAKLTQLEFINKCNEVHNHEFDYSLVNYCGRNHKIEIKCKHHGVFSSLAGNHLRGSGCPKCANANRNNNVRLTHEEFVERFIESNKNNPNINILSEYINMNTKISVSCSMGHNWSVKPQDLLNGHGCKICSRAHDRVYFTQNHLSSDTLDKLNDRDWLYSQHIVNKTTMEKIAIDIGVTPKCVSSYMKKHGIESQKFGNSQIERDVLGFLKSITNTTIVCNDRVTVPTVEIDLYLPEYNVGIEIDGVYWHGELSGRDKTYHLNKTNKCKDSGIRLIHVWDIEWMLKQDIVKSRIQNILKKNCILYARCCEIKIVSTAESKLFMNLNHIQGYTPGTVELGLFHNEELVGMMTFGRSRFNKTVQYELLRFATKCGVNIIGGASKLHNYFICNYKPTSIISYCDLRYGTGELYKVLGYKFERYSLPNQFYFKRNNSQKLYSRHVFQKHKLSSRLKSFDPLLTSWDNIVNNGYDRIWDCGNSVWIWNN